MSEDIVVHSKRPDGSSTYAQPAVGDLRGTAMASGSYRGVAFEIRCSTFVPMKLSDDDKPRWTFYLYLRQQQFPEGAWQGYWLEPNEPSPYFSSRVMYPYMEAEAINAIDFHGGCTYYEKVAGLDGEGQVIKVGCDYAHYMDEGIEYDLRWVLGDAVKAIDSLHARENVKVFCSGAGGFYNTWEGKFSESGSSFYSFHYQATQEDKRRAAE